MLHPASRPGGGQAGRHPGHPGRREPSTSAQRPALHRHRAQQAQEPLPPDSESERDVLFVVPQKISDICVCVLGAQEVQADRAQEREGR